MPKRVLTSVANLAKAYGVEPGDYLFQRLAHYIEAGQPDKAEALARFLAPYCRHTKGAEPHKETTNALREARLVVLGLEQDTPTG